MFYVLFVPLINIIFGISTSNNARTGNIASSVCQPTSMQKIAGNGCQTSGKYLPQWSRSRTKLEMMSYKKKMLHECNPVLVSKQPQKYA